MSKYFGAFGQVHLNEPANAVDNCEKLSVQMCHVDGGKLWRFLKNINLSDDQADTIMRDYFRINTYGSPVEKVAEISLVKQALNQLNLADTEHANFLKKLLGSNCYHGTVEHLCWLIGEFGNKLITGEIKCLPTFDAGEGYIPANTSVEAQAPATPTPTSSVHDEPTEESSEGGQSTTNFMFDHHIVMYLVEQGIPKDDRRPYLIRLFGPTTTLTPEEALEKIKADLTKK